MSDNEKQQTSELTAPGSALKALRTKAGRSLEDISQVTLITVPKLEALEADDYKNAGPAPAFVIGYIRAYAKALDVPANDLVKTLEKYYQNTTDIGLKTLGQPLETLKPQKSKLNQIAPWLAALVAIALILVIGQILLGKTPESGKKIRLNDESSLQVDDVDTVSDLVVPNDKIDSAIDYSSKTKRLTLDEFGEVKEVDLVVDNKAIEKSLAKADSITNSDATSDINVTDENVYSDQSLDIDLKTEADAVVAPVENLSDRNDFNNGLDQITLSFSDNCWIEIIDGKGKKIIARLATSGEKINIEALGPFRFKLGNAQAVSLRVNNRVINTEPAIGKRTKRFIVER